jgi:hypothetical protein
MVIVDQHAAHERLVYERMKGEMAAGGVARQTLLLPEVVELDPAEAERVLARSEELASLGLVIESFGPGAVLVRETPALLGKTDAAGLVRDIADDLAENGQALALKERLEEVCSTMACHGSVRAGTAPERSGDERPAARDGGHAALGPVQPRPADLCGAEAGRHRAAVRAAVGESRRGLLLGPPPLGEVARRAGGGPLRSMPLRTAPAWLQPPPQSLRDSSPKGEASTVHRSSANTRPIASARYSVSPGATAS